MIRQGDNFRLVEGEEAETSLAAYLLSAPIEQPLPAFPVLPPRPENDFKAWTKQDDVYLRQLTPYNTDATIAVLLGRTRLAVQARRGIIGVLRSRW